jgi:peptidoglycan/LPS O-acetylase OafA/YrhL
VVIGHPMMGRAGSESNVMWLIEALKRKRTDDPPKAGGSPRRVPELDGIRGIAILLVIGCHYEILGRQLWGLPKFGWAGVDIFFVLSGFLITSVLLNLRGRDDSFRVFYSRRVRRILPPYIIFLVLVYALSAAVGDHTLYSIRAVVKNAAFLQAFGGLSRTVHQLASGRMWRLAHSSLPYASGGLAGNISAAAIVLWSLSIEEYFYLLWAPAVLWMSRKWLAMTGIAVCFGAFTVRWLGFVGAASYFSIYHRCDALMFGAFVALLISSDLAQKAQNAILIVAGCFGAGTLAAVLVPMGNVLNLDVFADHIFTVFGFPSLSLMAASAIGLAVTKSGSSHLFFLRSRVLRFVGTISYSLYLFHGLAYLFFLHFFQPTWGVTLAALCCAVGLSWLSWLYVERPILEGRSSRARKQTGIPPPTADVTTVRAGLALSDGNTITGHD